MDINSAQAYIEQKASEKYKNKVRIDKAVKIIFTGIALLTVLIIFATIIYLVYAGLKPFVKTYTIETINASGEKETISGHLSFWKFLTGTRWNSGDFEYSIGWLIVNTIYLTLLSLILSVPLGILTALFITRMSNKYIGKFLSELVTILSAIPSVIIGVFAMGVLLPLIQNMATGMHLSSYGGRSILAAIIVLALMSFPIITTMTVTAIKQVDRSLIMSSLALGATKTQTNFKIVLKAAKSTIFASIILGMGRAIGEATAIQMVTGAITGPTFLLLDNTATITTVMLTGMGEASYGSLNYDARFSAGLFLMIIIILNNFILNAILKRIENKSSGKTPVKDTSYLGILTYNLTGNK